MAAAASHELDALELVVADAGLRHEDGAVDVEDHGEGGHLALQLLGLERHDHAVVRVGDELEGAEEGFTEGGWVKSCAHEKRRRKMYVAWAPSKLSNSHP